MVAEVVDILVSKALRVMTGLEGVLFRRQTESIPAHWVQHIKALHPLHPRHYIGCGVTFRVPDVQSLPRWVREHVEGVKLLLVLINVRLKGLVFLPKLLPLIFNRCVIVSHSLSPFLFHDRNKKVPQESKLLRDEI